MAAFDARKGLFADAAYYAGWLSIAYGLKDRLLKKLLVFSSKIADLTLFFVTNLKTEGKWGKSLSFAPKPPVRKDKAYRWLFLRFELQNQRWFYGFWGWLLCLDKGSNHVCFVSRISVSFADKKRKSADIVRFGFGEAISFSPSVSFTLMHVYMNTRIK